MKPKKTNSKGEGRLFIVLPTLEIMLSACENCKMKAHHADMEYSNFMKHCKMQKDLRIDTYTKCAAAFDKDVLLIHTPKGMIDSVVKTTFHKDKRFSTISQEDLVFLPNQLCRTEQERIVQHIIRLIHQVEEQMNSPNGCLLSTAIADFLTKLIKDYGA